MSSPAIRKPKPKVRSIKDHRPTMRIDIEKVEALAKLIKEKHDELFRLHDAFIEALNAPFSHVSTRDRAEEGQDAYEFMRAANYFLQEHATSLLLNSRKTGGVIRMAVTALRLFKDQQKLKAVVCEQVKAQA
ncbi:hypothetical protein DSECCO2_564990 [anaerobic digester metagenome]